MYATTDELHQFFVPFRGAKLTDVLIDGGGILLAVLGILFWRRVRKNRS
jgi:VanZ family protein